VTCPTSPAPETSDVEHIGRDVVTREARTKNGFAPRICAACGRPFEWRKKWARDWENVRWCSDSCRQRGV